MVRGSAGSVKQEYRNPEEIFGMIESQTERFLISLERKRCGNLVYSDRGYFVFIHCPVRD